MARRKSFNAKDRARVFEANGGKCHLCGGHIQAGEAWEVEHRIPWALTQDDSDENLRPAHVKCHKIKTHQEDRPAINRAKRREAKHKGFARPAKTIQSPGFQYKRKKPLIDKSALPPLPPPPLARQVRK